MKTSKKLTMFLMVAILFISSVCFVRQEPVSAASVKYGTKVVKVKPVPTSSCKIEVRLSINPSGYEYATFKAYKPAYYGYSVHDVSIDVIEHISGNKYLVAGTCSLEDCDSYAIYDDIEVSTYITVS